MATIEHDFRDPPPRQPDDPGAYDRPFPGYMPPPGTLLVWTGSDGRLAFRWDGSNRAGELIPRVWNALAKEEDAVLARRIANALAACDEDGTPLVWPSRVLTALVFVGGLVAGAIGMAVLITGVEWVR